MPRSVLLSLAVHAAAAGGAWWALAGMVPSPGISGPFTMGVHEAAALPEPAPSTPEPPAPPAVMVEPVIVEDVVEEPAPPARMEQEREPLLQTRSEQLFPRSAVKLRVPLRLPRRGRAVEKRRAPAQVATSATPAVIRARTARKKEGGKTIPPRVLHKQSPGVKYPAQARRLGLEGEVILLAHVSEAGTVERVAIDESSGHKQLDRAALRAVERWIFRPAQRDGIAIAMSVRIPVRFRLNG